MVIPCKTILKSWYQLTLMQSKHKDFYHHVDPLCCPFIATPISPSPHALCTLAPINLFPHFYHVVISRMLHELSHVVYNFLELSFFCQNNSLKNHSSCCIYEVLFLFLITKYYSMTRMCHNFLIIYLLKDIWVVFSLGLCL